MPQKKLAMERLGNLFDIHGEETPDYFQNRLMRVVFILQNMTTRDCTKEQITYVSTALQEIYDVFEKEEERAAASQAVSV
jgi:hypothetical protein